MLFLLYTISYSFHNYDLYVHVRGIDLSFKLRPFRSFALFR